ncbi:hypothetical protein [Petrachloros mirabilis]
MRHTSLVILGSGYTGRYVLPLACSQYMAVLATSRRPAEHLTYLPKTQRVEFDLASPDTWTNIPASADLLWCFPAVPLKLVQQLAEVINAAARRLIVLGSTSAYAVSNSNEYPPLWIDETSPISRSTPRVQGEEFLMKQCGATILRVAGIYGPGRNPLDWIRSGRVVPSQKYVNLIHVEDLAAICLAALKLKQAGEVYNVSDGTPRTWNDIYMTAQKRWNLSVHPHGAIQSTGKRISTQKLRERFGVCVRHSDLFTSLETLEGSSATSGEAPSRKGTPVNY